MTTLRKSRILPPLPTGLKDDPAMQTTQQQQTANAVRANNYNNQLLQTSIDSITGSSVIITTAKLSVSGTQGTMTFVNGLLTDHTDAT